MTGRADSFSRWLDRLLELMRFFWMLQQCLKLFAGEFTVAKDFCEKTWTNGFTGMYWHHGHTAVTVPEEMVTTLDAHHLEPYLDQRCDDFFLSPEGAEPSADSDLLYPDKIERLKLVTMDFKAELNGFAYASHKLVQ